jgi:hypothetical protein
MKLTKADMQKYQESWNFIATLKVKVEGLTCSIVENAIYYFSTAMISDIK